MKKTTNFADIETFAKGQKKIVRQTTLNCVIYTRVSTKEQAENNQSLITQMKYCEDFVRKNNYTVLGYFGGTYESAKNDERKEFNRMLSFVKKSKEKISMIIVYSVDRFSRSGANAIYITSELKKHGVSLIAVTQPTDTNTPSGNLQQNIQFIFSQYDNDMRREKCMAGTKERLLKGLWCGPLPTGYSYFRKDKEHKIVINEKGMLIRKAFLWKSELGITNTDILTRLKALGFTLKSQTLSDIFRNPFYCGMITHNFLEGQIIEGTHEKLISKEVFLKVNQRLSASSHYFKQHSLDTDLPLRHYVKCGACGTPFVGYIVKKKNLGYYKCNKIGCKCNRSAKLMHNLFFRLLGNFKIEDRGDLIKDSIVSVFYEMNKSAIENQELLNKQVKEIDNKMDMLQEKYVLGDIGKDVYEKFNERYKAEKVNSGS